MIAIEMYFPTMFCEMIVTSEDKLKIWSVTVQMKAIKQYFQIILLTVLLKIVLMEMRIVFIQMNAY